MNKAQIKAELRRSACEDEYPFVESSDDAFDCACSFTNLLNPISTLEDCELRTFFLLVAEAL